MAPTSGITQLIHKAEYLQEQLHQHIEVSEWQWGFHGLARRLFNSMYCSKAQAWPVFQHKYIACISLPLHYSSWAVEDYTW